jgi:two-component system, sensor histidine kinase LadS
MKSSTAPSRTRLSPSSALEPAWSGHELALPTCDAAALIGAPLRRRRSTGPKHYRAANYTIHPSRSRPCLHALPKRLHRIAWCLLLLIAWAWLNPNAARAGEALVIDSAELAGQTLGQRVDVLEDVSGTWSIEQVVSAPLSQQFHRSRESVPGFGFSRSAYWLRIEVDNRRERPQRWLLELSYPPLDDVQLFVPRVDGSFEVHRTGDHLPFSSRDISYQNFLFELDHPPGVLTYYMRVRTSGAVILPMRAWSPNAFLEHLTTHQPPMWIFFGLLLVMAAYNLFVFFSVREAAYLYYVCYILSYAAFQFSLHGYAFQFFWPNQTWWNGQALTIFIGCAFGFGILFQRRFVAESGRWFPRLDRYCQFVTWASFLMAVGSLFVNHAIGIRILVVWGVHVIPVGLVAAGLAAYRGSRAATFYLAAWLVLLTSVLLYLLQTLGLVPNSFVTQWGLQLGASIEVTLLSLGLADRINVMRSNLQVLNRQLTGNVSQLSSALAQAEAATRAKSEFLATVSHELRTPLNAIINIPEGLLEDFGEETVLVCGGCDTSFELAPDEQPNDASSCPECHAEGKLRAQRAWTYRGEPAATARHLGYIHNASKHLLSVVSSILDFSKVEGGHLELNVTEVDLAELLEEAVSLLKQLAESKGVTLALEALPRDSRIRGDRVKLAQIVVNLMGNAIKFSDGRGEVRLEIAPEPDAYVIRVSDGGIGIAPADCQRIFESFSQVDSSNTRKFGGTGLGLAISKKLVELHDGTIWVESKLGEGSTFSVRLPKTGPRVKASLAGAPEKSTTAVSGAAGRPDRRTPKLATPEAR